MSLQPENKAIFIIIKVFLLNSHYLKVREKKERNSISLTARSYVGRSRRPESAIAFQIPSSSSEVISLPLS